MMVGTYLSEPARPFLSSHDLNHTEPQPHTRQGNDDWHAETSPRLRSTLDSTRQYQHSPATQSGSQSAESLSSTLVSIPFSAKTTPSHTCLDHTRKLLNDAAFGIAHGRQRASGRKWFGLQSNSLLGLAVSNSDALFRP
jgi:hypothetical protein